MVIFRQALVPNLKLSFPLLMLLTVATIAVGQSPCSLKHSEISSVPEFYGLRLGLTEDEVRTVIPQIVIGHADDFGVTKTTINPYFEARIDKTKFAGVRSISLDFLDERLTSLWIGYDDTFKVQSVEDFVRMLSQSLHLPNSWSGWKSKGQQLRCGDFQLIVTIVAGGPSVRLLDTGAEDVIAERRQAKEDRESANEVANTDGAGSTEVIGDKKAKVYYPPGCSPPKVIAEGNRIVFHSIDEAEKRGFKPDRTCH